MSARAFRLLSEFVDSTTRTASRLQEYLAVGALPDLTDAEVDEIDQTGGKEHHRYFVSLIGFWTPDLPLMTSPGQVDRRRIEVVRCSVTNVVNPNCILYNRNKAETVSLDT